MINKLLVTFVFLLAISNLKAQELPFDINGKEWQHYKRCEGLFNSGKFEEVVKEYEDCRGIIAHFPVELYKYAMALWVIDDSLNARTLFREAMAAGLRFEDPQTLDQSPLIYELTGTIETYKKLRVTIYMDEIVEETQEYQLLMELREADQYFRTEKNVDQATFMRADSVNRERFRPLLKQWNWPGIEEVGYQGEGAAFLIAQHADSDLPFQKECLKRMEREFLKGNITISSYAMLIDRYLVNTNKKQIFGTQLVYNEQKGEFEPQPLQYPSEVEALRTLFRLGSLEDYLKLMKRNDEQRFKE